MKPRRSIRTKLIISYIAVTLLSLTVLSLLFSRLLEDYLYSAREQVLISRGQQVVSIVQGVVQGRPITPQAGLVLENMGEFLGAQVWLVDRSGLIVAASGGSNSQWKGIRLDREELQEVMEGTIVTRRGRTGRFATPMITVAVPVNVEGQVVGALFMNTPVSAVQQTFSHVRRLVMAAAAFALMISSLAGVFLSRSITGPLQAMTGLVREMTRGVFGRRVPVHTEDEVGELGRAFNLLADELEKTLGDLQEERDRFQSIVAGIAEGVIAVGSDEAVLWINQQAAELLRVGHISPAKLHLTDLPVPVIDLVQRVAEKGQIEELDISPAPQVVLRAYGSPIRRRSQPVGVVVLLQDVSEARRLENMRRDFLASVTHELRTPLTSIRGFVEPLLDGTVQEEEARNRYLRIVRQEALRLNRLIDDLLDLAKLESGTMSMEFDTIDLLELATRTKTVFAPQAEQKGVELRLEYPAHLRPGDWKVVGDSDRLQQVLTNFLDNALRHTDPGGRITLELMRAADKVVARVSDTGHGIDPEELPFVWDRFYKGDKSRGRGKEGTGLGLSIARGIIENHGGEVFATSKVGEGATFGFALPLA